MEDDDHKFDYAQERTEWAEDRTILANERTFAGWTRTGLASVGLGLGFQAIFRDAEPVWVAKAIATLFIVIGVGIFVSAYRGSKVTLSRLHAHDAVPTSRQHIAAVCGFLSVGALLLAIMLWTI